MSEGAKENKKESPYFAGRREWNERYGSYLARERNWRLACFSALGLAAISIAGAMYLGTRSRFVPYIVEVDKLGQTHFADVAVVSNPGNVPGTVIQERLTNWIQDVRSVWTDGAAQKVAILRAYNYLTNPDPAMVSLNEYFKDPTNDPWTRAKTESVAVETTGPPLQISNSTWQIEWKETLKDRSGKVKEVSLWRASVDVYISLPKTPEMIRKNPLGIFIKTVSWTKQRQL